MLIKMSIIRDLKIENDDYSEVIKNAKVLAETLITYGFNVLSPPRVIFEGRVLEPLKIDIEEDQKEKYAKE